MIKRINIIQLNNTNGEVVEINDNGSKEIRVTVYINNIVIAESTIFTESELYQIIEGMNGCTDNDLSIGYYREHVEGGIKIRIESK